MTRDFLVGLFFLGFIASLGVLTMKTGAFRDEQYRHNILFDKISGLSRGDEVRMRGARIGEVEEVGLPNEYGVPVKVRVAFPLVFRDGATFRVTPLGALGGTCVEYMEGTGEVNPKLEQELRGTGTVDLLSVAGELVEQNRERVSHILEGLEETTTNIRQGKGLLGKLVNDAEIAKQADEFVANMRNISRKIEQGEGALGTLINDPEMKEGLRKLPKILENLERVTAQLTGTEGPLGVLLNDPEAGEAVRQMLADVQEQRGLLGRLISDDELANEVASLVRNLEEAAKSIREGEGILPRLLNDEDLAMELEDALQNLREISDKINRGEGSVGKLVNDDALIRDIRAAAVSLRDTTEDAREQAPINAFFNALFSIF